MRGVARGSDLKYAEDFRCPQNNQGILSYSFQTRIT